VGDANETLGRLETPVEGVHLVAEPVETLEDRVKLTVVQVPSIHAHDLSHPLKPLDSSAGKFDIGGTKREVGLWALRLGVLLVVVLGATGCAASSSESDSPGCDAEVDVIFWGGVQWVELATALARNPSKCAEYFVTVPPQDSERSALRGRAAFREIRRLDPRIHPVAEIRFTGETGWREWVVGPHPDWAPGRTFFEAGVEARRRMAQSGLDVAEGETWAFNEFSPEVLENVPGWREEVRDFLRGLYEGEPGMPKAPGIVFNIFVPSDTSDVTAYKARLKAWLVDEAFWRDLDRYVDFFAEEVYPSPLTWGVADASPATRTEYLNDYLFHMLELTDAGPDTAAAAQGLLRSAYVPLANAAWPHEGIGKTNVISAQTMSAFVSAQVDAIRNYPGAQREDKRHKIGFAWAPNAAEPSYSEEGRDMILARLATAIRAAYEDEPDSQIGACGPSGEDDLCAGDVEGAFLNDAWKTFASWD
jgi:hypothetical protein